MSNVERWLKDIHLEQYFSILFNNGYTSLIACLQLNDGILQTLGIDLPGHRKRILAHLPKEHESIDNAEYGNLFPPVPTGLPLSANSKLCDVPPPKDQCLTTVNTVKYLNMDRNSKVQPVPTPDNDDEDCDNVYDTPPVGPRPCGGDVSGSDDDDYVPADPAPMLPPKRSSKEDIDAKLGITSPAPQDSMFGYSSQSVGPPLIKPVRNLRNSKKLSGSFDSGTGSLREKPVPKPRASLQNKKPKPVPRDRLLVQSKSDSYLDIPSDIVESMSTDAPIEEQEARGNAIENIGGKGTDVSETSQHNLDSQLENAKEQQHESIEKEDNGLSLPNSIVTQYDLDEEDITSMVDNSLYETKHKSVEENNEGLLSEDICHKMNQGSKTSSSSVQNADELDRIVIGAELSQEENDNLANEMLYQETKVPRLKIDDSDQRVSYAGIWDMRSGSEKGDKIPVNEVKPIMREDVRNTSVHRSSYNIPPPSFSPPPLPKGFNLGAMSPTLTTLPIAPGPPPVVPPVVPPRSAAGVPESNKPTVSKKTNGSHNLQASLISELAKKQHQSPPHVKVMDADDEDIVEYEMEHTTNIGEENPVYSTSESIVLVEPPPAIKRDKEALPHKTSMKKPPAPPPKVENPFKDMYDPFRGTYCLEESTTDYTQPQASGWESEDTLSDGGDFLDEEETDLSIDVRRSTLQRMSSIPIISVTKSRILERTGYLYKKSSGKSEGNPITGSYKAINRWQKRWVDFDSINLTYYATNTSQISNRIIPASSIINVEQDIRQGDAHPFQFILRTVDRTYTFAADDANNLSMWTSLIMSTVIEQSSMAEFLAGGDMHQPYKEGFVKMEGAKGRRYIAMKGEKFCYYNTYNDFMAGSPIHVIEMKLASVKDIGRNKLQMHTPYAPYVLFFETSDELLSWKGALEEAIAEGLGDNSVLADVYENHSNRFCADCGSPDPHWASVNIAITLCKWCAGIHRNISIPTSKVRSLRMDLKIWTPALKEVFKKIGNDESSNFWEWNAIDIHKIDSDVDMVARKEYLTTKYIKKTYVRYHPLKEDRKALNEALCKSVQYEDVVETMQLLFSGADILYCSDQYNQQTPFQIAKAANQTAQMEFLHQNGAEGSGELPVIYSPTTVAPPIPLPTSVTLKGHLYKTGSNVKREFLKRWVILEHNIISYYESENKSQAKDSIQKDEMLSVALTSDDRMPYTFELATIKDRGRVYLFAADTEAERNKWMSALAKTITPAPQDKWPAIKDISRGGVLFIKHGSSAKYQKAWMQVHNKTIQIFDVEKNEFSEVDLRRIKSRMMLKETSQTCEVAMEKGSPFLLDLPNEAFYIQADLKKETEEWFKCISKLCEGGGTLSEQQLTRDNIPVIVDKCICYVEQHGLKVEGIYRLNGQHSKVSKLLSDFSKDASGVLLSDEDYQIHDVSTTLKRFFRSLEDPLMSKDLYRRWIQTANIKDCDSKLQHYVQLLEDLPGLNKCTLEKVMRHLHRVTESEAENKMSVVNIASIFGPIMLNTTQDQETQAQGFASTNHEIAVFKDLLENQQFYFQMNTVDRQKEKKILEAMKKMEEARNVTVPAVANEMLLSIHVRNKDDPEVVTHKVSPAMTAQEVLSYVMKKRRLKSSDNWGLYEIICNEEMERPIHFSEKVLDVTMKWSRWPSEFCKDNHLCVKTNYVYNQIEVVYDASFSLFGELRYSDKKQFKKFAFEFSQFKLSYHKRDAKAMTQLGSWNVEDLVIYVGTQHERRPPTKWTFTFIPQGQELVKTRESPFFGHTVCCNNQEELYRWIAAMLRAQQPQGLQPSAESSSASSETPSQIELNTPVPPGGASAMSTDRQLRGEKSKSKFFQKLLHKNNR